MASPDCEKLRKTGEKCAKLQARLQKRATSQHIMKKCWAIDALHWKAAILAVSTCLYDFNSLKKRGEGSVAH
jgi:hypothetical protein